MSASRWVVLGAAIGFSLAMPATAQRIEIDGASIDFSDDSLRPSTPQRRAFAEAYLAAVSSGKSGAIDAMVHPASFACNASPVARKFIEGRITEEVARPFAPGAKVVVTPYMAEFVLPPGLAHLATLPLAPTAILAIDSRTDERDANGAVTRVSSRTVFRAIFESGNKTFLVLHCLTAEGERTIAAREQRKPSAK